MPKYNIYKIKKKKQSKLVDNLKDSGLEKIETIEIDNYNLIVTQKAYNIFQFIKYKH